MATFSVIYDQMHGSFTANIPKNSQTITNLFLKELPPTFIVGIKLQCCDDFASNNTCWSIFEQYAGGATWWKIFVTKHKGAQL